MIIANKNNPKFTIIDIRSQKDYQKSHISNAMNISYISTDFSKKITKLNKGNIYLFYCYIGGSSKATLKKMSKMNFKEVYNLTGEFTHWNKQNLPVVKHK